MPENKVKLHVLKIQEEFYIEVLRGDKKAELRNNDRNFQVGDLIHFTDVDGYEFPIETAKLGYTTTYRITHILDASVVIPDIKENKYVILSIERVI